MAKFFLIFSIKLPFTILLHIFIEWVIPIASVEPWLLITGPFNPNNIAPLYILGSNLFLKSFNALYKKRVEILFIISDNNNLTINTYTGNNWFDFSSKDVNNNKEVIGLGGHTGIAQGGFFMNNIINDYNINNFYSDGDNYEDLDQDGFYETYKYKYPNNIIADYIEYNGKNLSYISGDKNSEGIKFDSNGNFYFLNNALYLEPDLYHPYEDLISWFG